MFSSLSTCARHVSYSWLTASVRVDTAGGVPLTTETKTPRAGLGEAARALREGAVGTAAPGVGLPEAS